MKELPVIESCNGCGGSCCQNSVSPPFCRQDKEWENLDKELKTEIESFYKFLRPMLPDEYPCMWLDDETGECTHYEHRPKICRDFEMGGEDCRRIRVERGVDATKQRDLFA